MSANLCFEVSRERVGLKIDKPDSAQLFLNFLARRGPYPWLKKNQAEDTYAILFMKANRNSAELVEKLLLTDFYGKSSLGNKKTPAAVARWQQQILQRAEEPVQTELVKHAFRQHFRQFLHLLTSFLLCHNVRGKVDVNLDKWMKHQVNSPHYAFGSRIAHPTPPLPPSTDSLQ